MLFKATQIIFYSVNISFAVLPQYGGQEVTTRNFTEDHLMIIASLHDIKKF